MNFFRKIGILIYFLIIAGAGASYLLIASGLVPADKVAEAMTLINNSIEFQAAVGVFGALLVLFGLTASMKAYKKLTKSKLITFQNPDGEVTISLSAIEAYVHRVAKEIPGIKDVKSTVKVNKKGIDIKSYVSISAGTNIPDATEVIQMTVKNKVHDMLGIDENISIKMHINKILKGADVQAREEMPEMIEEEAHEPEPNVPYRG